MKFEIQYILIHKISEARERPKGTFGYKKIRDNHTLSNDKLILIDIKRAGYMTRKKQNFISE